MAINEQADEEIIIINKTNQDESFKIYIHLKARSSFLLRVNENTTELNPHEEERQFLVKTPQIVAGGKWKSSSDYGDIENADSICIESRLGNKYIYYFETKRDKLYITVKPYKDNSSDW